VYFHGAKRDCKEGGFIFLLASKVLLAQQINPSPFLMNMKRQPKLSILRGLLFLFDIDNVDDVEREEIIVSKNVNDEAELAELFDMLMRPEFTAYSDSDREWYIDTLNYYLGLEESFDSVFDKLTTYFDDEVEDRRKFMQVLLECLLRYQAEMK
jgi:hypothetical protein